MEVHYTRRYVEHSDNHPSLARTYMYTARVSHRRERRQRGRRDQVRDGGGEKEDAQLPLCKGTYHHLLWVCGHIVMVACWKTHDWSMEGHRTSGKANMREILRFSF